MESDGGSATSTSLDTVVIEVDVSDLVNRDIGEISVWRTQWECIQGNRAGQRTGLEYDVLESEAVTRIRQPWAFTCIEMVDSMTPSEMQVRP